MGYYTKYTIEADCDIIENVIDHFIGKNPNLYDAFESNGESLDPLKWYDHEGDMIAISSLPEFKDRLITLHGEGEGSRDIWIKYFLNGKVQKCEAIITFEPFDVNKLK